ncbi:MAG: hypothetical protein JWM57_853 [Phycisphaerales bacterium]|nr:hypothetical protein [Phycisphaerales bacterium]
MRLKYCGLAAMALGLLASSSPAALLIGSTVTGVLNFSAGSTNYFDPANALVPAGFLNTASPTVTVQEPAIEFGFQDGSNRDTANFTDSQLLIQDQYLTANGSNPFVMKFTDAAFAGLVPVLVTNTFSITPTASITGNVLTVSVPLITPSPSTTLSLVLYSFVPVPEPTSMAALGLGAAGLLRRRRAAC